MESRDRLPASTQRSASGLLRLAMTTREIRPGNLKQAVPFFGITNIDASLAFYVDGLGFTIKYRWEPDGRIRWCWLERDGVVLMLQEYVKDGHHGGLPVGKLGLGMS